MILFARTGRLQLPRDLFGEVLIPPAVEAEVVAEARGRPGGQEVAAAPWLIVEPLRRSPADLGIPARLGAGEAEAIALALQVDEPRLLILDDGPGRRAARQRGLQVVGSAGLLVLAKEAGLLVAVKPALDELLAAGLFLDARAYRDTSIAAGEA